MGYHGHHGANEFFSRSRHGSVRAPASGAPFLTGRMLMSSGDGAIQHHPFQVGILSQPLQHFLPYATLAPGVEPRVDAGPGTEGFRHIPARGAGPMLPKNRFDHWPDWPVWKSGAPHPTTFRRKQGRQFQPHFVRQKASRHRTPRGTPGLRPCRYKYNPIIYLVYHITNAP